jgi:RNA polymerase sigma factor (sigma-70 family)
MTTTTITLAGRTGHCSADERIVAEFNGLWRRLVGLARFRYRLCVEDCEEIAADALLSWYQELCRHGSVRADAGYLHTVLHHRALTHIRTRARVKRTADLVPLDETHQLGVDPQLDGLVAEREELADRAELARDVLTGREREILILRSQGVSRAQIAARYGVSVRCVERRLERAQRTLDEGLAMMRQRGRCAMLALTVSDINTGQIGPGDPRYERGIRHLNRCARCRTTPPIQVAQAG